MALISVSNNALSNITALPASIPTGALTLIKSITASASASIEFINGTDGVVLDGTYSSYVFSFSDIHPSNDSVHLTFNMSTDGGSNYNVTKTTTSFFSYHNEADNDAGLTYLTGLDLAQSTADQIICGTVGNLNDESFSGTLQLFNPSSTTYVKHFLVRGNTYSQDNLSADMYFAGYGNTVSAVNSVRFKFQSGNIDDGTIKLYGVS